MAPFQVRGGYEDFPENRESASSENNGIRSAGGALKLHLRANTGHVPQRFRGNESASGRGKSGRQWMPFVSIAEGIDLTRGGPVASKRVI